MGAVAHPLKGPPMTVLAAPIKDPRTNGRMFKTRRVYAVLAVFEAAGANLTNSAAHDIVCDMEDKALTCQNLQFTTYIDGVCWTYNAQNSTWWSS